MTNNKGTKGMPHFFEDTEIVFPSRINDTELKKSLSDKLVHRAKVNNLGGSEIVSEVYVRGAAYHLSRDGKYTERKIFYYKKKNRNWELTSRQIGEVNFEFY